MSNIKINLNSLSSNKFKKTVRHKIVDGSNVYRFLPPFGQDADGYPYRKWNVVWGLIDPNSGNERPFASSSTYEKKCPIYDYLDLLKAKIEGDSSLSEARLKLLNDFISNLRPKTVYAYNAANKSGEVGVLELKPTAHKKVIAVMNKYITEYDQDPTSLNSEPTDSGLWFNITRSGRGFDTTYDATKNQSMKKDANGIPTYQDDRGALAESIVQNYNEMAYDLNNLYQKLSYDELKDILVANLINKAEKDNLPEILVPGFGLDGETVVQESTSQSENHQQTTNKASAQSSDDTDDILALADEIFNN